MADRPQLPELRNPMLDEERAPMHETLVERRCLGQTELKVKPGQVNTSNATKPDNLGTLDYAHLRVPLPKDLSGSGIFLRGANRKWPEAYFLMRRSSDGFISATGMFKAAFPYAQQEEELLEKDYIKSLPAASSEEVAGNVWIDAHKALELADEYGIKLWIAALLDPTPITHGTNDPTKKGIKSPPAFHMRDADALGRTPGRASPGTTTKGKRSVRGANSRSMRSESPTKASKPTPRKIATPRKPRKGRGALASVDETASVAGESVNGENGESVRVEVETTTVPGVNGDEESTKVNITMPANNPDLEIPHNAEEMLAKARQMVREAADMNGETSTKSAKGKRKAEDMVDEDEAKRLSGPVKKPHLGDVPARKQRIIQRAAIGMGASLAIGALIPSIIAAFPW
ncbi:apses transcription factor like protein [Zymoseptoria brevis]|uniref:Apses transcription factor like protein n=1 Tax=Zymoseptoria brevis TaxID=1047168 RepID=A0A0F4GC59_9PEZI|nr:apses transcription factor like protein [Zymoseptoria brevis]